MRILKWIFVGLGTLIAVPIVAFGVLYVTDPTYYGRMATVFTIDPVKDVDWYEPLERVPGVPGPPLKRATPDDRTISEAGWQKAVEYALETKSVALVVWHLKGGSSAPPLVTLHY